LPNKKKKKSVGIRAYETGKKLEERVTNWLTKQGYRCGQRIVARGKVAARPYEVDVYATKGSVFKHHMWVECKAHTIKRTHVHKLIESARDVKDFNYVQTDLQKWAPNMLMLVSDDGFDVDAIKLAAKYKMYCVKAGKTFEFIGRMTKDDMKDGDESKFT